MTSGNVKNKTIKCVLERVQNENIGESKYLYIKRLAIFCFIKTEFSQQNLAIQVAFQVCYAFIIRCLLSFYFYRWTRRSNFVGPSWIFCSYHKKCEKRFDTKAANKIHHQNFATVHDFCRENHTRSGRMVID